MEKVGIRRERLSIDLLPEERRRIKAFAALHDKTIKEFVLESILERLRQESESKELVSLTTSLEQDPILKKLWNNEKDSAYYKL
jgi:uncharacterized protein (DUF1778 family)